MSSLLPEASLVTEPRPVIKLNPEASSIPALITSDAAPIPELVLVPDAPPMAEVMPVPPLCELIIPEALPLMLVLEFLLISDLVPEPEALLKSIPDVSPVSKLVTEQLDVPDVSPTFSDVIAEVSVMIHSSASLHIKKVTMSPRRDISVQGCIEKLWLRGQTEIFPSVGRAKVYTIILTSQKSRGGGSRDYLGG